MKKKLLLVVAALLQIVTAMAQNGYRPLLEEGKIWKYNYHSMMRQSMKSLTISGDTVIRNQTYKKIVDNGHTIANHTYSHAIFYGLYNSTDSFINEV